MLSTQVRNILTHLERILSHTLPIIIVRQNMDGMELEFANMLVEDSNNDALSYTDCATFSLLCRGSSLTERSNDGS